MVASQRLGDVTRTGVLEKVLHRSRTVLQRARLVLADSSNGTVSGCHASASFVLPPPEECCTRDPRWLEWNYSGRSSYSEAEYSAIDSLLSMCSQPPPSMRSPPPPMRAAAAPSRSPPTLRAVPSGSPAFRFPGL